MPDINDFGRPSSHYLQDVQTITDHITMFEIDISKSLLLHNSQAYRD